MLAVNTVTEPVIFLALILFFALPALARFLGCTIIGSRWSIFVLLAFSLPFLLHQQIADYLPGYGGDYDFGFPFRWITTQSDAGSYRFRGWACAVDAACGVFLWAAYHVVRRFCYPAPPNNALQRTEAGGRAFSDLDT